MTLDEYIRDKGVTEAELAGQVGVTQPYIGRLRKRYRRASPEVAKKLEKVTGIPAETFAFAKTVKEPTRAEKAQAAA